MKPRGRPSDLPAAERYEHGTRARYVTGCRCDECRAANTRAYHMRQARAKVAASEISAPVRPVAKEFTGRDGRKHVRTYKRACPGVHKKPCPFKSHLQKNSKGGVCRTCRNRLIWNGLVSAAPVRRHLLELSAAGVGSRTVAAACDVGATTLREVISKTRRRVRANVERRVLAVTVEAIADHAIVDGAPTWQLLDELLARGFRKGDIAKRLGMKNAALQLKRGRILARTAYAVAKLHRTVTAPLVRNLAPAPVYCNCVKPVVFELDGQHYCGSCDELARPEGVAKALERQALTKSTRQELYQMGTTE